MEIKNYMEQCVDETLPEVLKSFPNVCNCEKCVSDIKAIALNKLKPHYVVTEKGKLYSKLDSFVLQNETDVVKAIIEAIIIVSSNPKHQP